MGQILSNPVINKEHHTGSDGLSAFGLCAMQGWRMSMEDDHIVELQVLETTAPDHIALYAIFDGHGGSGVAEFCSHKLLKYFKEEYKKLETRNEKTIRYRDLLINTLLKTDKAISQDQILLNEQSGATATLILISKLQNKILCANSGDSRTVLSIDGSAKTMSFDHKPTLISEYSRIVAANGFVEMDRVNGNLALSRAMGDFGYKKSLDLPAEEQIVTPMPDILEHQIDYNRDEFVILACDGIWDCLSSQNCVDLIHYGINKGDMSLNDITSRIIDVCCAPSVEGSGIGCDNMSINIVALLKENEILDEWFERIRYKNRNLSELISFEERRKMIYHDYLPKIDKDIFEITTKKSEHAISTEEEMTGLSQATSNSSIDHQGSIDLFSIEALLEAGIQAHEISSHAPRDPTENGNLLQTNPLSGILQSLSSAAAGEVSPFISEEEEESELESRQNNKES